MEDYIAGYLNMELGPFFDQYLRDPRLPILEYYFTNGGLYYRWQNTIPEFNMAVDVYLSGELKRIYPTTQWLSIDSNDTVLKVEPNYYIAVLQSR